jgi:predicted methyltransferase
MIHSLEAQLNPADPASVGPAISIGQPDRPLRDTRRDRQHCPVPVLRPRFGITGAQYVVDGARTNGGGAVTRAMQG